MSNTNQITLTIEPFEYILTLQDSALQIVAKHVDECFIWSTILNDILQEPDTVKMDFNTKKQFIAIDNCWYTILYNRILVRY